MLQSDWTRFVDKSIQCAIIIQSTWPCVSVDLARLKPSGICMDLLYIKYSLYYLQTYFIAAVFSLQFLEKITT